MKLYVLNVVFLRLPFSSYLDGITHSKSLQQDFTVIIRLITLWLQFTQLFPQQTTHRFSLPPTLNPCCTYIFLQVFSFLMHKVHHVWHSWASVRDLSNATSFHSTQKEKELIFCLLKDKSYQMKPRLNKWSHNRT